MTKDYSLREDKEDRRHILLWKTRQHGSGRTWRIGGNDFVGESEQVEKRAEIEKERETRDATWSLKDERGERLENKSWRASRDLADTASGKSHRSVTEEQEGKKKRSTGTALPPLRQLLWFRFYEFCSFPQGQIELTLFRSHDLRFEIFKVNLSYRSINTEIYFRCHNGIPSLMAFIFYSRSLSRHYISSLWFTLYLSMRHGIDNS